MSMRWPENLIEEIAHRRTIFFLGSGISATARNSSGERPKTWTEFLETVKTLMKNRNGEKDFVDKMIRENNNLMALQAIYSDCDKGEYSRFLKSEFSTKNYEASEVHEAIKEIDNKIVITTNFDKIYDNLCSQNGYVVCEHTNTNKIISNIKSSETLIIKAHGCIDNIDEIIFTGDQYYQSKRKNHDFYKILESLFLTHTVIFLGYGLADPDINLVLENIINTGSESTPHYILVKEGLEAPIRAHWEKTYNISSLEFGADYTKFSEKILELKDLVLQFREERRMP